MNELALIEAPALPAALQIPGIEITATLPHEMAQAQQSLIAWFERKVAACRAQEQELRESWRIAQRNKWRSTALKRHADLAAARAVFYGKVKDALLAGYCLMPPLPIQVFAMRSDAKTPRAKYSYQRWDTRTQTAKILPQGKGQYLNPVPLLNAETVTAPTKENPDGTKQGWWADEFQDEIDFPLTMAKPQVMEVVERAMALKIFDEIGVLPPTRKDDPVIVGQIINPQPPSYGQRRRVSFLIAWHLNVAEI